MATKAQSAALAEQWRQHVDAWKASGQSQSTFCRDNELNYHRLCY
ncbi:MAG: IS66 family insertion sequence element accessory protein TnpA [Parahaliea sp.]